MNQSTTRNEVAIPEPSERLKQAIRMLYEYVLQQRGQSTVGGQEPGIKNYAQQDIAEENQPAEETASDQAGNQPDEQPLLYGRIYLV